MDSGFLKARSARPGSQIQISSTRASRPIRTTVNNCETEFSDTQRRIAKRCRPKLFYRKSLPPNFINNIHPDGQVEGLGLKNRRGTSITCLFVRLRTITMEDRHLIVKLLYWKFLQTDILLRRICITTTLPSERKAHPMYFI